MVASRAFGVVLGAGFVFGSALAQASLPQPERHLVYRTADSSCEVRIDEVNSDTHDFSISFTINGIRNPDTAYLTLDFDGPQTRFDNGDADVGQSVTLVYAPADPSGKTVAYAAYIDNRNPAVTCMDLQLAEQAPPDGSDTF